MAAPGAVSAQEETGSLYGTVSDGAGQALPGVRVTLFGMGAKLQVSDDLGQFRFLRLEPGVWSLEAALDGFSTLEYPRLDIRAGRNTTVEVELSAAIEDRISVNAESPLLDERKLSQGTILTRSDLENIPTSGDPWSVLNQAPGVLVDRIDVGGTRSQQSHFTVPGVQRNENEWQVDGVNITDMRAAGFSSTYFDMGQFAQAELSTGGNEISKATPGVSISLVTKRGTNEFRGSARFLVTEDDLFLFFKQSKSGIDPGEFPPGQDNVQTNAIKSIEDTGFDAGGPAVRDRLWFWGSYGTIETKELTAGGFDQDIVIESEAFKANAQLSGGNSLVASWINGDKRSPNRGAGLTRAPETVLKQRGPTAIIKLGNTHVFGSQLFLTGGWGKVDGGFEFVSRGFEALGNDAPQAHLGDDNVWRGNLGAGKSSRPSEEWKVDGSYFFNTGSVGHELKFGARLREYESQSNFVWSNDNAWSIGIGADRHPAVLFTQRGIDAPVSQEYRSAWVQDTISAGNWTVNAGVRYDLQDGSTEPFTAEENKWFPALHPTLDFPGAAPPFDWTTVSPRLGVTYGLGEARKTLLRASYARFSGQLTRREIARLNPAGISYLTMLWHDVDGSGDFNGAENLLDLDGSVIGPTGRPGPDLVILLNTFDFNIDDPLALTSPNLTDPGFDPELTDEVILGVEHALRPNFVVGATLTWRNRSDIHERRRLVRELGTGLERSVLREDYERCVGVNGCGSIEVIQPDGSPFTVDFYRLGDHVVPTGGSLLLNGDREVEYLGATLSATKRLSNGWMLRSYLNYGDSEWKIPESFFAHDDPTDVDAFFTGGPFGGEFDNNGDLFAQGSGRFGQLVLHSTWSFNVNGLYQVAPDRPWGFNVAGNIYGREGYPRPLFVDQAVPGSGGVFAQAMERLDSFRYEDVYTVDLRLDKEFAATGNASLTVSADVFNLFNEGYVLERVSRLNPGQESLVLETLGPRIWRLGVRLNWR